MPSINPIMTTAGRAAIVTAVGLADTLTVTDAQVSDTNQAVGVATTALTNVVKTLSATGSVRVAGGGHALHVVLKDDSADVYELRAFALRLSDGTFLMVYAQAGVIATKAAGSSLHFAFDVTVDADTAATIEFGDTDYVLPMAGEGAPGIIELATNAEVQTGTDATRAVTPAGLAACTATETRVGVIELATTAEVQTGTDTDRAVTPAGLAARTATLTRAGVVELATSAETVVGLDTLRAVTPGGLQAKIDDLLAGAGPGDPVVFTRDMVVVGFTADSIAFTSPKTREIPIQVGCGHSLESDWIQFVSDDAWETVTAGVFRVCPINGQLPKSGTIKKMRASVSLGGAAITPLKVTLLKRVMDPTTVGSPNMSDEAEVTRTANGAPASPLDTGTLTLPFDTEDEQWFVRLESSSNAGGDIVHWVSLTIQDAGEL